MATNEISIRIDETGQPVKLRRLKETGRHDQQAMAAGL